MVLQDYFDCLTELFLMVLQDYFDGPTGLF